MLASPPLQPLSNNIVDKASMISQSNYTSPVKVAKSMRKSISEKSVKLRFEGSASVIKSRNANKLPAITKCEVLAQKTSTQLRSARRPIEQQAMSSHQSLQSFAPVQT